MPKPHDDPLTLLDKAQDKFQGMADSLDFLSKQADIGSMELNSALQLLREAGSKPDR